jgi:hypothetical protein
MLIDFQVTDGFTIGEAKQIILMEQNMSAILSIILQNGIYILPCIVICVGIVVLALSNAENCTYPAECFNCNNSSCYNCDHLQSGSMVESGRRRECTEQPCLQGSLPVSPKLHRFD